MRSLLSFEGAFAAACALTLFASAAEAQVVPAGDDAWITVRKHGTTGTIVDMTSTPLPADFFYPGSDPFMGSFVLRGVELDSDSPGAESARVDD